MFEFFEKNWRFLLFASTLYFIVFYSIKKENQNKEKKAQEWKDAQKKSEENQKDKK